MTYVQISIIIHSTIIPEESNQQKFCILVAFVQVETAVVRLVQTANLLVQALCPTTRALPIMVTGRNSRPTILETRLATAVAVAATAPRRAGVELLSLANNCSNWRESFTRRNTWALQSGRKLQQLSNWAKFRWAIKETWKHCTIFIL